MRALCGQLVVLHDCLMNERFRLASVVAKVVVLVVLAMMLHLVLAETLGGELRSHGAMLACLHDCEWLDPPVVP